MPPAGHPDKLTLAEVAANLKVSVKTLRRALARSDVIVTCVKVGRTRLFRPADVAAIERALECHFTTGDAAKSGIATDRSGSGRKRSELPSSAQDSARSLLQKARAREKKPASETKPLTARKPASAFL